LRRLFVVETHSDLDRCYPIMKELRPHLSSSDYHAIYQAAKNEGDYKIAAIEDGGQILALMGYRILHDYVRGKHVYVDDLVSTESARSKGLGAELLRFAESIARQNDCKVLRLCTGVENVRGVEFYERNGWTKRAYAFTRKL